MFLLFYLLFNLFYVHGAICVTVSHLDENILTSDNKLPGYHETFRNDRNCFGGGVLAYKAEYLHVIRRNDLEFNGGA